MIKLPRLVLPGIIIKPEDIYEISGLKTDNLYVQIKPDNFEFTFKLIWIDCSKARTDYEAPFTDKNEKLLFENDIGRLKYEDDEEEVDEDCIVKLDHGIWWELKSLTHDRTWNMDCNSWTFEFKYILSYGKETN